MSHTAGGSILIDTNNLRVEVPRSVDSLEEFQQLQIPTAKGQTVSLGDLARIDLTVPIDAARVFKSSGTASVLVFVSPKPGGNIKAMSDGAKNAVDEVFKGSSQGHSV